MTQEIRCTAEHPRLLGRLCNAKLFDVADGTVVVLRVRQLVGIGAGCSVHTCPRCGATYVLSPRPVATERAG